MTTTINDVTFLQGFIALFNSLVAISYFILAWYIMQNKTYLKWKVHIYPITMFGCYAYAISQFWELGTNYYIELNLHQAGAHMLRLSGAAAIGYAVWQDVERLIYKKDLIDGQELQIKKYKAIIDKLNEKIKNNGGAIKIFLLMFSLFLITNCNARQSEIDKMREEKSAMISTYNQEIAHLNARIKEVETRETESQSELNQKKIEINVLSKQRDELKKSLDKTEKTNLNVINPVGPIKITDAKGTSYEFQGGQGTQFSNQSESVLKTTINKMSEQLQSKAQTVLNLTKSIFTKDKVIKEKQAEIDAANKKKSETDEKLSSLNTKYEKLTTKTGTWIGWWIIMGICIPIAAQLLWAVYKPKKLPWGN